MTTDGEDGKSEGPEFVRRGEEIAEVWFDWNNHTGRGNQVLTGWAGAAAREVFGMRCGYPRRAQRRRSDERGCHQGRTMAHARPAREEKRNLVFAYK